MSLIYDLLSDNVLARKFLHFLTQERIGNVRHDQNIATDLYHRS